MNKRNRNLLASFNEPGVTLVVSGWPEKGVGGKNHGMAWYTKEVLTPQAKKYGNRFVVLAEKNHKNNPYTEVNGRILVWRVFDDHKTHLYPQIQRALSHFSRIKKVMVHSEFGAKGGIKHFMLLLPFLALIRILRKQIVFFSHNVIGDVGMLSGHLNLQEGSIKHKVLNFGLRLYYVGLSLLTENIVVLDEALYEQLKQFVSEKKIVLAPIPVEKKHVEIGKKAARKRLGLPLNEKIIMSFGFLTWYKGADWMVKEFDACKETNVHLVMAGGPSHSLQGKGYYDEFYEEMLELAAKNKSITVTGFVPEKQVALYFTVADLVVFPYRGMMGASGSLVHALSYGKPVMVSTDLGQILENKVVGNVLSGTEIHKKELLFVLSKTGILKILDMVKDQNRLNKLAKLSRDWASGRTQKRLVAEEQEKIYMMKSDANINISALESLGLES
jgi:glycosyltransferase involved in cell wall biosynthesis